jgi:hypothetical protein
MANRLDSKNFHQVTPWEEQSEDQVDGVVAVSEPLTDSYSGPFAGPHEIEQAIWHELQNSSGCRFSTLIVRRLPDGVCLQGVLETEDDAFLEEVDNRVKRIACVNRVLTQFVVRDSQTCKNG